MEKYQDPSLPAEERASDLLPALPAAWPEGRVTGLRARGGLEAGIAWKSRAGREYLGMVCVSARQR